MKKSALLMKKRLRLTFLAFILSLVIVPVGTVSPTLTITQTDPATMVFLDPPTIDGTAIGVGNTVTVNINISDAPELNAWQASLIFNATLLTCTGFFEGGFFSDAGDITWTEGSIDNVAGKIEPPYAATLKGLDRASGDGRLARLTFEVKAEGVSDLHLRDVQISSLVWDGHTWITVFPPFNIIDVYTVVLDGTPHKVVTVSDSTREFGTTHSGFYDHAFSMPDKEVSFKVTGPSESFSNVTIPKALLEPVAGYGWGVIIDGNRLSLDERTITENATHTSIHFTYSRGIRSVQVTTRFLSSTISITLSSTAVAVGSGVTISGGIDPVRPDVDVTIEYRPSGGTWTTLETVTTDLNGNYNYTWTPETVGTYEVRASWEGDPDTIEAVSEVLALDAVIRDLEVSLEAPTFIRLGFTSWLNATVYNSGTFNETDVELQILIEGTVVNSTIIPELLIGESYPLSYLRPATYVEATYNVTAYAPPKIVSGVGPEKDTTNNVATKFVMVRAFWITITPESGSTGSLATVEGFYFPNQTRVLVTFNDMLMGYATTDEDGYFKFDFNVPVSAPGPQFIKAFYTQINYTDTIFTVIDVTPLDIEIDVGTTHFRGESAEFYVQITFKGEAVNATSIEAWLYGPNNKIAYYQYPQNITFIARAGFYKITYPLEGARNGTYALVIEASYTTSTIQASGTSFKTFLLSLTLTDELAQIEALIEGLEREIEDLEQYKIDFILLGVEEIKNKITAVNATLGLATINVTLGLAAINEMLQSLNETISQLETRIDTIKEAQEALTPPLYAAMALALIAAVGAILSTILLRRKTPAKSKPKT